MLSAVEGAGPRGAELEAFLSTPCNHMARLIRDLCEPSAVRENLKDVLKFIKDVRSPDPSIDMQICSRHPFEGDRCSTRLIFISESHCHCQTHTMHLIHRRPDAVVGSDATTLCWLRSFRCISVTVP